MHDHLYCLLSFLYKKMEGEKRKRDSSQSPLRSRKKSRDDELDDPKFEVQKSVSTQSSSDMNVEVDMGETVEPQAGASMLGTPCRERSDSPMDQEQSPVPSLGHVLDSPSTHCSETSMGQWRDQYSFWKISWKLAAIFKIAVVNQLST